MKTKVIRTGITRIGPNGSQIEICRRNTRSKPKHTWRSLDNPRNSNKTFVCTKCGRIEERIQNV